MKVAFIGHRKIVNKQEICEKLYEVLKRLIVDENADEFYFGSKSEFNHLCYEVVTKLKEIFTNIRRVNFKAGNEPQNLTYDATIYQTMNAGAALYINRNKAMIDGCDVLIAYYNENYAPVTGRSGTKIAYYYAHKKHKRIINVFL